MTFDPAPLLSQKRFQAPEHWEWSFTTLRGISIRYGMPRSRAEYKAVIVIWGGLGDFGEQYFEFAHDVLSHNMKPVIIDLPGQGGSGRYLTNPHKRHSAGFDEMIEDLFTLISESILSTAVDAHDNHKRLPMILFSHSMGGHVALRFLKEHNLTRKGEPIFSAAALTAPMIGIRVIENLPALVARIAVAGLSLFPSNYVPQGSDWYEDYRDRPGFKGIFSSDPDRSQIQKAFFISPESQNLKTGSPTNKWLKDAYSSCLQLQNPNYLKTIETPLLIAIAGQDQLVSNTAIRKAASFLKNAEIMELPGAQHEIIMEADAYRQPFIDRFFTFIAENVLNNANEGKKFIT